MCQKEEIDGLLSDIEVHLQRAKLGEPQLEIALSATGVDGVSMARQLIIRLSSWLNKMDPGMRAYALQKLGAMTERLRKLSDAVAL